MLTPDVVVDDFAVKDWTLLTDLFRRDRPQPEPARHWIISVGRRATATVRYSANYATDDPVCGCDGITHTGPDARAQPACESPRQDHVRDASMHSLEFSECNTHFVCRANVLHTNYRTAVSPGGCRPNDAQGWKDGMRAIAFSPFFLNRS